LSPLSVGDLLQGSRQQRPIDLRNMFSTNDYRTGWALRCLREAEIDLREAETSPLWRPLCVSAMRRAQSAIYHALGDREFMERIVGAAAEAHVDGGDPLLAFLIRLETLIDGCSLDWGEPREKLLRETRSVVDSASKVVKLISGKFE